MNFLKAFIELRDDARQRLDKCRSELAAGKIHLEEFENAAREYYLREAALRLAAIYQRESDAQIGKWNSGDYFIYHKCADLVAQMAYLGETFYDIKHPE